MKFLPTVGKVFLGIFVAALAVVLISGGLIAFRGFFSTSVVALLYLLVVVICTTLAGFMGGIAASILAFLAFNYFFLPPFNTFRVYHTQDLIALFVFLVVAVVISNLMGRAQTRLEQIEDRERESTHLYELSSTLTGIRDEKQIAEVLARHVFEVFQAMHVDVLIQSNLPDTGCQDGPCIQVRLPDDVIPVGVAHQFQALSTNRGQLGEIHLWTAQPDLSSTETRLLQTIASHAALAVERTLLSQAENRTHVLEESDRLKTAILSSVSHDLRTPLASIQAAATSLSDPSVDLDPAAKDDLQSLLLEETEHLNQLVGNLLNMSRIEAGALKLQKQWNSLADLIDTVVDRMQRHTTHHVLEIDVSEDLPLVEIDATLIEQVFINLISNSIKYAPPRTCIRIRAFVQDAGWMQVVLQNQGPAIPEEHIEHIFEKFYTFPGMRQVSSTGLGLSICKGIIEAHGGRIWAANHPDGLAFFFTLPLSKSDPLSILPDEGGAPE
jgi:two-component system, OmpR family, sensor histidine kinase KdpD